MKRILFLFFVVLSVKAFSQKTTTDSGKSGTLSIKAETSNTQVNMPETPSLLLTTDKKDAPLFPVKEEDNGISMQPKEQFLVNRGNNVAEKVNKSLTEGKVDLSLFKRDQYLGDIKSNSKKLKIVCRDYQYVDGDRIKISFNDTVIKYDMMLEGGFKGFEIDLPSGFNKIDFEALNMGSSAPNTAELVIFDDKGNEISSTQWNLYTGFKASIVVVKE